MPETGSHTTGTSVSASLAVFGWSENARQFRLPMTEAVEDRSVHRLSLSCSSLGQAALSTPDALAAWVAIASMSAGERQS